MELDNSTNITVYLPIVMCMLLDIPDSLRDCSAVKENGTRDCIECPVPGRFLTGDTFDEPGSPGRIIVITLWLLTFPLAVFGTGGNIFIIWVLRRQKSGTPLDTLLVALSFFEMASCVTVFINTGARVTCFGNLSRGPVALYTIWIAAFAAFFTKSVANFLTVGVSLLQYITVVFPLKVHILLSKSRVRVGVVSVVFFSFCLGFPRFSGLCVRENIWLGGSIKSIANLTHFIGPSQLQGYGPWCTVLRQVLSHLDFWLPFPLLIVLNVLVYRHISKVFEERELLLAKEPSEDVRAALRMFIPVVIAYFVSTILSIAFYVGVNVARVAYRELYFVASFCSVADSAVTLPLYYWRGSKFRKEADELLVQICPRWESVLAKRRAAKEYRKRLHD